MANDLKFVDSVASGAATVLDLNDRAVGGFYLDSLEAPPPTLRRNLSDAILSDGQRMSSSAYDNRAVRLGLRMIGSSDQTALAIQKLGRAIDQPLSLLRWQPQGATRPVFFRVLRSPITNVDESMQMLAHDTRRLDVELMAEPAAYGLPVDFASAFTITNDPTTGTNRMIVGPTAAAELGAVQGDLDTPLLLAITSGPGITIAVGSSGDTAGGNPGTCYLCAYSLGPLGNPLTHGFLARDLTQLTSGTDTGALVSGAGSRYVGGNYKECTFATTTALAERLSGQFSTSLAPMPGLYRVLMRVVIKGAGTGTSSTMTFQFGQRDPITLNIFPGVTGDDEGLLVDFGVMQIPEGADHSPVGLDNGPATSRDLDISISAGHTGIYDLRFDELYLLPVETVFGESDNALVNLVSTPPAAANAVLMDAFHDRIHWRYDASTTSPFTGIPITVSPVKFVGGLPTVRPGVNNYLMWLFENTVVTDTTTFKARYYPRILYVRPATT